MKTIVRICRFLVAADVFNGEHTVAEEYGENLRNNHKVH